MTSQKFLINHQFMINLQLLTAYAINNKPVSGPALFRADGISAPGIAVLENDLNMYYIYV